MIETHKFVALTATCVGRVALQALGYPASLSHMWLVMHIGTCRITKECRVVGLVLNAKLVTQVTATQQRRDKTQFTTNIKKVW
jgi:hypothetical protein